MSDYTFKVGELEAEVLTAMVRTPAGPLFLSQVLPGHWAIQRPGTPDGDATPSWGGGEDGFVTPRVPFFPCGRLEEEIGKASDWLLREGRIGNAGAPDVTIDGNGDDDGTTED